MTQIRERIVLHFPGFEPLDADAHMRRFERAAAASGKAWSSWFTMDPMESGLAGNSFVVRAEGEGWLTRSRIHVFDHNALITGLRAKPLGRQITDGYRSAAAVVADGGVAAYWRHAWRFCLFFMFPFLLVGLAMLICTLIAALPLISHLPVANLIWTVPLAYLIFRKGFIPLSDRLHTLHLFADWQLAVALARMDDVAVDMWLANTAVAVRAALARPADEYVITSHSMGSSLATHVLGMMLEREPDLLAGKTVSFVTLGGALLQCALLRPADTLRKRVDTLARCHDLFWLEVQCLTDAIHFYKSRVVAACGFEQSPQATILAIRFKHMLSKEHYSRIKRDLLRVHRQYVLGSDYRSAFDFTILTAGPLPVVSIASNTPGKALVLSAVTGP